MIFLVPNESAEMKATLQRIEDDLQRIDIAGKDLDAFLDMVERHEREEKKSKMGLKLADRLGDICSTVKSQ
jgi:hypothetical protein